MIEKYKNSIIKLAVVLIALSVCLFIGYGTGYYRCNKRIFGESISTGKELQNQIKEERERSGLLESELEYRIQDCNQYKQQLEKIRIGIENIGEFSRRSRQLIDSIGTTVQSIESTSSNSIEIIRKLQSNQSTIRKLCTELSNENNRLNEQLRTIQESIDKQ